MDEAVAEAFTLLGDETRLRIVDALGEHSDSGEFSTLPFAELREAVGMRDSGNFNYHLQKLVPRFVEATDEGYRLALPGIYVYRALRSGTYAPSEEGPRHEIEMACEECGAPEEVWVAEGRCHHGCADCGIVHNRYPLPAGGLARFDAANAWPLLYGRLTVDSIAFLLGFCPYCSGSVHTELSTERERLEYPEGDLTEAVATMSCEWCRWYVHSNVGALVSRHPALLEFYLRHGADPFTEDVSRSFDVDVTVESRDPWRLATTLAPPDDSETLRVVFDGSLAVVELAVT